MKKVFIIVTVLGLLILTGFLGLRIYLQPDTKDVAALPAQKKEQYSDLDLRPLITAKLKQIISDGSDGLYDLSMDSISIDLLGSELKLFNVALNSNDHLMGKLDKEEKLPEEIYNIHCQSIVVEGVNADDFITSKTIDLDLIKIVRPHIKVVRKLRPYNAAQRIKNEQRSLHQKIAGIAKKISINKLVITEGTLTSANASTNKTKKLNDLSIQLNDILIDSTTKNDNNRFLFAKEAFINTRNYAYRTPDSLYLFTAKNIAIKAPAGTMNISGILFKPRLSKTAFQKNLKSAKERYDVTVNDLSLQNINWWQLFNDDVFVADKMNLKNAAVGVYLDRSLQPPASKVGNFPHQLLMQLQMPMYIKNMQFSNVDLTYDEHNPMSGKTGRVVLQNINGNATNITNMPEHIGSNSKMVVNTHSTLLNKVPLDVTFTFDLNNYKSGNFTASINTGYIDGVTLNKMAEPLGLFSIDKGEVQKLAATVTGNNKWGKGKVLLLYNDLNISVLKKDEKKKNGLKEKELLGFFANTFVIKDENPKKNDKPRTANVTFERDVQTGFFNLAWKTVLAGILETIGANQKLAQRKK